MAPDTARQVCPRGFQSHVMCNCKPATAAPLTDAQKKAIRLSFDVFDNMLRPDRMASLDALVSAFDALWLAFPDLRPKVDE